MNGIDPRKQFSYLLQLRGQSLTVPAENAQLLLSVIVLSQASINGISLPEGSYIVAIRNGETRAYEIEVGTGGIGEEEPEPILFVRDNFFANIVSRDFTFGVLAVSDIGVNIGKDTRVRKYATAYVAGYQTPLRPDAFGTLARGYVDVSALRVFFNILDGPYAGRQGFVTEQQYRGLTRPFV